MCLVKQYLGLETTGFYLVKQHPDLGFTKTKFCLGVLRLSPCFKASPVWTPEIRPVWAPEISPALGTRDKSCFGHQR